MQNQSSEKHTGKETSHSQTNTSQTGSSAAQAGEHEDQGMRDQAREVTGQAQQKAQEAAEQAKQKASETAEQVRQEAESRIDRRRNEAADRLGGVAQALRRTGQDIHERDDQLVGEYVEAAANQVEQFSDYLQKHNTGDLIREVQRLAARQPELAAAGALAAGFLVGRFLKSTRPSQQYSPHEQRDYGYPQTYQSSDSGPYSEDRQSGILETNPQANRIHNRGVNDG